MTERIYAKPGKGAKPRHPDTNDNVPAEGQWFNNSSLVRRMLRVGDLVLAEPPKPKPKAAAKPKAKKTGGKS